MSAGVPLSITFVITAAKLIMTLVAWFAFYRLARRGEGGPLIGAGSFAVASLFWFGWALASTLLAVSGFFASGYLAVPLTLLLTLALGFATYAAWPGFRRVLAAVPQSWLIGVQVTRVIGASFLIIMAMGLLPAEFALPAGIGDILVGLAAPFVAYAMVKRAPNARNLAIAWNIFGILDLVVAVSTGFAGSPLVAHILNIYPLSTLLTQYPLTQVPTFLVPVVLLLHVLSLRGLLSRQGAPSADVSLATASR